MNESNGVFQETGCSRREPCGKELGYKRRGWPSCHRGHPKY